MSQQKITQLTPEQEALILVYREKWRAIALSTERIDRLKAKEAVKAFYTAIDELEPNYVIFFDSPYAALSNFENWKKLIGKYQVFDWDYLLKLKLWGCPETIKMYEKDNPAQQLGRKYDIEWIELQDQLFWAIDDRVSEQIDKIHDQAAKQEPTHQLGIQEFIYIAPESIVKYIILATVFNYTYNQQVLEGLQSIVNHCGWIFPFEKTCIVCDRPTLLSFDNEHRLHAEGEPAILFADGYSLYSHHGVTLPEKYGKIHPNQWLAQWLLEETNAEIRRALIQGIGYEKICQELQTQELDSWQE